MSNDQKARRKRSGCCVHAKAVLLSNSPSGLCPFGRIASPRRLSGGFRSLRSLGGQKRGFCASRRLNIAPPPVPPSLWAGGYIRQLLPRPCASVASRSARGRISWREKRRTQNFWPKKRTSIIFKICKIM